MSFYNQKSKKDSDINITPLIDVVFILLIFFMVSTSFVATPGFKINLPKTKAPSVSTKKQNIVITINKDRKIDINGELVSLKNLELKIRQNAEKIKISDPIVILKADEKTSHGYVVNVMDIIKQSGLTKIAIATKRVKSK